MASKTDGKRGAFEDVFMNLFDTFLRHGKYVENHSENTISAYQPAWKIYRRGPSAGELSKA